jgi:molecular chaperone GrpE
MAPATAETESEQPAAEETNAAAGTIDAQLATLQAEVVRNRDGWQRTLAEFQNYKRRIEREQQDAGQRFALDTISRILPVIDDFERAAQNIPDDLRDAPWVSGTLLILNKLHKLLQDYDVEIIDPVGEVFDPNRHEAVGSEDTDAVESGRVSVTLQKGYVCGDRILRPALVRVAS